MVSVLKGDSDWKETNHRRIPHHEHDDDDEWDDDDVDDWRGKSGRVFTS